MTFIVTLGKVRRDSVSPIERTTLLQKLVLSFLSTSVLIGCGPAPAIPVSSTVATASPGGTTPVGVTAKETCSGGSPLNIGQPSIYLDQDGYEPYSVLVFPQQASGSSAPIADIPGTLVSLDGAGNMYVLSPAGSCIVEYPAASTVPGAARFLPVGPGTKISAVQNMVVSANGTIYISDGKGIAVFGPTATGDADPTRYLMPNGITPGLIAVDNSDNLYVQYGADSSVAVFGPTATGMAIPSRTITGVLTAGNHNTYGMATDSLGSLYVLCICEPIGGGGRDIFGVLVFSPTADGNATPIRQITSPDMSPCYCGPGLALDSAGVIYITAEPPMGVTQTVFEFPANSSGDVHPSNIVTSPSWTDTSVSHITVH